MAKFKNPFLSVALSVFLLAPFPAAALSIADSIISIAGTNAAVRAALTARSDVSIPLTKSSPYKDYVRAAQSICKGTATNYAAPAENMTPLDAANYILTMRRNLRDAINANADTALAVGTAYSAYPAAISNIQCCVPDANMSWQQVERCMRSLDKSTITWTQIYRINGAIANPTKIIENLTPGIYRLDVWQTSNLYNSVMVNISATMSVWGWSANSSGGGNHVRITSTGAVLNSSFFSGIAEANASSAMIINTPGITPAIMNSTYSVNPSTAIYRLD